jgi:hypothetical protein
MQYKVRMLRLDAPVPVNSLLVELSGVDALGAEARPVLRRPIPVEDAPPVISPSDVRVTSSYGKVAGYPIVVFVRVADSDDDLTKLMVDWQVTTTQGDYTLSALTVLDPQPDPNDSTHIQYGGQFVPKATGAWTIEVTATDPSQNTGRQSTTINVVDDQPPCLAQWAPNAPGQSDPPLPISQPTLFQVPIVTDDLDPYPPDSDPLKGVTQFRWSLQPPGGGPWQVLAGATGNHVQLDPSGYVPGDVVDLRVEIQDRVPRAITCADNLLTCSVISSACIQRQTWKVEMR